LKRALGAALLFAAMSTTAYGQISDDAIKIGVITDVSGPYMSGNGLGSIEAIRMAIADVGGTINGKKIELLFADHQNKGDVASAKAREWLDQQKIDALFGGGASAAGLAMAKIAAEYKKPFFVSGSGSTRFTNEECTPYTVHYAFDSMALAKVGGTAIVRNGGKKWYFLALDSAFGNAAVQEASKIIEANGGEVLGVVKHPAGLVDFSSFVLRAQSSGAEVLGLANAGADTVNAIKAASEFKLTKTMRIATSLLILADVASLGLDTAQGLYTTDSWYWDQSAESRAWSRRFFEKMKEMPAGTQAAQYSAALHYLQAVQKAGTDDGPTVMATMRDMPINDMYADGGYIRADGVMVHRMYLMEVKSPEESKYPWDYFKLVATVPGEEAFTTKSESRCALWK
jgi:branched-chain amino acid transport system substrate-binding protein